MEKGVLQGFDTDDVQFKLNIANAILRNAGPEELIGDIKEYLLTEHDMSEHDTSADMSLYNTFSTDTLSEVLPPLIIDEQPRKQNKSLTSGRKNLFGNRKKKRGEDICLQEAVETELKSIEEPNIHKGIIFDERTQTISSESEAYGLKSISDTNTCGFIRVEINIGKTFSIGRYDAGIGRAQSDFEFDRTTKAVSRRHAVIERSPDGYYAVDIGSSAGTYINSVRIPANVPQKLTPGDRISFGNGGTDYIWVSPGGNN